MVKLYNSESRKVEEFIPYDGTNVKLYTCGPTVYHFAHIGNLRTYIMEYVLEKSLTYLGYNVERAMNITDVGHIEHDADSGEDKMLIGAKRENKSVMEIANFYTENFKMDMEKLRLSWPKYVVPATSLINDYIKIITNLMEKGYAYFIGGNVYFDVSKLNNYYRFGNQSADDLIEGVRDTVDADLNKKNKNDFVLWFTKSKFENQALKWESPWGIKYPGWHIECTAISLKTLGEKLDIHCGGVDNKFPHHTNEIAQSESYIGHKWCKYWFHVEHLVTLNGKMSKSSGEFITLSSLQEKGYIPEVYKFLCLQSHYRKQLLFSYEILDSAKNAYEKLMNRIANLDVSSKEPFDEQIFNEFNNQFKNVISNDLNTSLAITTLFDVLKYNVNDSTKIALLSNFDNVLDIGIKEVLKNQLEKTNTSKSDNISSEIYELANKRAELKKQKDYKQADEIRQKIIELGYEIVDTPNGPVISKNEI